MPKVSVIIPNFNDAIYIQDSILSVLNQTLGDIVVIIVDDCSTDNSWEILQQLQRKDSRIKIIKNVENSGAGISRNLGLDIATGQYIKFLDSDDTMDEDVLEVMYNAAQKNSAQIVCGYMQAVNKDGTRHNKSPFFYKKSSMLNNQTVTPETPGANRIFRTVGIGDALYKKDLFTNVRFPKLKWEDFATIPIIKYSVGKIFYIDKAVYNYRQHESSTTSTDEQKKTPRILDIVKCCDILRKGMPSQYQEEMDSMECFHILGRAMDVSHWKDCEKEAKSKIISALYRIVKIDVPNYSTNKFINIHPLVKAINNTLHNISVDSIDLSDSITVIKQFDTEPINLSNTQSNYDAIILAYRCFCKNMELLYNSQNSNTITQAQNGKESNIPRFVIENHLMKDLQKFYISIEHSNDYNDEQKQNILNALYKVCISLVPNAIEHLIIPNYPEIHSYLRPEFENFSREECIGIVEDLVHSSAFQKYSMARMTAHCVKKTPYVLFDRCNRFIQSIKSKKKGREFDE